MAATATSSFVECLPRLYFPVAHRASRCPYVQAANRRHASSRILQRRMGRSGVLLAAWVAIAGAIGLGAPVASARTSLPIVDGDSLTIAASPNPITFGGATTVSGALNGTSNANQPVSLGAQAAPFTGGFQAA